MKPLTLDDVRRRVAALQADHGNDEMAHSKEEGLHREVLAAIAAGACSDPAACAAEALLTLKMNFARWCA